MGLKLSTGKSTVFLRKSAQISWVQEERGTSPSCSRIEEPELALKSWECKTIERIQSHLASRKFTVPVLNRNVCPQCQGRPKKQGAPAKSGVQDTISSIE